MSLLINDLKKGWQNKARHELMHPDAIYVATNVDFTDTGALKCRKKHAVHSELFVQFAITTPASNIYQINVEGVNKQLIYFTSPVGAYRWNSATNVLTGFSISLNSTKHISYAAVKPELSTYTYVYMTDGVTMLADNGTLTRTWGIDPPESAPTVAIYTSSGDLSVGAYSYVYTYYDNATGAESDPSPTCADISVAADESVLVRHQSFEFEQKSFLTAFPQTADVCQCMFVECCSHHDV